MSTKQNHRDQTTALGPACIHLRSKQMYITGQIDPEEPDHVGTQPCWCNLTQHVMGPDKQEVDRLSCIAGRACFEG